MTIVEPINLLLLSGALLLLLAIMSSLVAARFGAPLLLVFVGIGMLAGEDGPGGLPFANYQATFLFGSIALAAILFDGGMRTRLSTFKGVLWPSVTLATGGVVLTAGLVAAAAMVVLALTFREGVLLGAIVASTDAAAVFLLLRSAGLTLRRRVEATLEIESSTNDPIAIFLTVVLVHLIAAGSHDAMSDIVIELVQEIGIGTPVGILGGFAIVLTLNKVNLPQGLHAPFALVGALVVFGVAAVAGGSGFLAAYLAGLVLGNRPVRSFPTIAGFHDATTWIFQIVMFIMLGMLCTPSRVLAYALPALAIAGWLMVVARPLAVWICLTPFRYDRQEKLFISWVGLRGAVSIFLASLPVMARLPNAELYFDVAFAVVLVSMLVQGWSLRFAAEQLDQGLARTHAPVSRVEIDLPGQQDLELVGYPIPEAMLPIPVGAVPAWARLVMVARDGRVLDPAEAERLLPEDTAYILTPPRRVHRLDRLFAPVDPDRVAEFLVHGSAQVSDLAEAYALSVPDEILQFSIAELFADRLGTTVQPGDRLPFDQVTLVAREIEEDRVVEAGLQIAEEDEPPRAKRRRVARKLARLFSRANVMASRA